MEQAPPFHEPEPLGDDRGWFVLAEPGTFYLSCHLDGRPQPFRLAGGRPCKPDLLDPWERTVTPIGAAQAGDFTAAAPRLDTAHRHTPYGACEKLRPEARIAASALEVVPPLEV